VFSGRVLRWHHLVNAYGVISLVRLTTAACLAKPICYTRPVRRYYSLCCPAWQLVCMYWIHWCIDLFSCKAASVFNKPYFTASCSHTHFSKLTQHLSACQGMRGTVERTARSSPVRGRRRADSAGISDRSVPDAVDGSPSPAVEFTDTTPFRPVIPHWIEQGLMFHQTH